MGYQTSCLCRKMDFKVCLKDKNEGAVLIAQWMLVPLVLNSFGSMKSAEAISAAGYWFNKEGTRESREADGIMRSQDSYCSRTDFRDAESTSDFLTVALSQSQQY